MHSRQVYGASKDWVSNYYNTRNSIGSSAHSPLYPDAVTHSCKAFSSLSHSSYSLTSFFSSSSLSSSFPSPPYSPPPHPPLPVHLSPCPYTGLAVVRLPTVRILTWPKTDQITWLADLSLYSSGLSWSLFVGFSEISDIFTFYPLIPPCPSVDVRPCDLLSTCPPVCPSAITYSRRSVAILFCVQHLLVWSVCLTSCLSAPFLFLWMFVCIDIYVCPILSIYLYVRVLFVRPCDGVA